MKFGLSGSAAGLRRLSRESVAESPGSGVVPAKNADVTVFSLEDEDALNHVPNNDALPEHSLQLHEGDSWRQQEEDDNDSSRKFTLSYKPPEASNKDESEITSNASIPIKYEE